MIILVICFTNISMFSLFVLFYIMFIWVFSFLYILLSYTSNDLFILAIHFIYAQSPY